MKYQSLCGIGGALIAIASAVSMPSAQSGGTNAQHFSPNTPALWSTPGDGRLVMLIRNTDGFTAPIGARVRFCVTNLTGSTNAINLYVWTTGNPWDMQPTMSVQQTLNPKLGDCIEIDHPSAMIVQDATLSGIASGYYELLEPTALPVVGSSSRRPPPRKPHWANFKLGDAKEKLAKCVDVVGDNNNFRRQCHLEVDSASIGATAAGVRICVGNKFVNKTKDNPGIDYPPGYLELIVDKAFLPPTQKPSDYDYNWNPTSPNGCRDVIAGKPGKSSLSDVYFMVAPRNPAGGWDASKVDLINVTTQLIYHDVQ